VRGAFFCKRQNTSSLFHYFLIRSFFLSFGAEYERVCGTLTHGASTPIVRRSSFVAFFLCELSVCFAKSSFVYAFACRDSSCCATSRASYCFLRVELRLASFRLCFLGGFALLLSLCLISSFPNLYLVCVETGDVCPHWGLALFVVDFV